MSVQIDASPVTPPYAAPGDRLGPYKLLQRLGDGGMGTVWQAEQSEPVRRAVAVKLIKPGMDSKEILTRFEAERRALALMDHPNIARVFDAGMTPAGRPYFVMELVKGVPLTKYCDDTRLTVRERLGLFINVCHAVQHAHQKGIIHRDLKPSNVLVCLSDDKPVPKVIDFGLAKALHGPLTEQTLVTELGVALGTPEYMAPEQADLTALNIDTRADIYALGAILYELLTGARPFDGWDLRGVRTEEYLRIIREVEPPAPSKRLTGADTLTDTAACRATDPRHLSKLVRGELDWIVMKCLEKDRTRRYETANGLAMHVERYLRDEPVLAGPPSKAYRLKKFVRRNKGPVLAATMVLLTLVGGIMGTTWGMVNAQRAREQALRSLGQLEKSNEILGSVFKDLNPYTEEKGGDTLRVQLGKSLVQAAAHLEGEAVGDPVVVARLQTILGNSLRALGHYEQAQRLLEQARQTLIVSLSADNPDTLLATHSLARAYLEVGRLPEAIELLRQVRDARLRRGEADHPDALLATHNLAVAYELAHRLPEAIELFVQVRDAWLRKGGADHPDALFAMHRLAGAYLELRRLPEAIELLRQVRDARLRRGEADHPDTLSTLERLAGAYRAVHRLPEAIELLRQVRDVRLRRGEADHLDALLATHNLAVAYQEAGRLPEAIELLRQVRDAWLKKVGDDHPHTLLALYGLAGAYRAAHRLPEAIELFVQVRDAQLKKFGAYHRDTLLTVHSLAEAYWAAGKPEKALPLSRQAAEGFEKLNFQPPYAGAIVSSLSIFLEDVQQYAEAEVWRRKWLEVTKERAGASSVAYATELMALGRNLLKQRKAADAETVLEECLALREKLEPDAWTTFNAKSMLGEALLGQKKYADAEPLLVQGYEGMKQRESKIPKEGKVRLTEAAERLVHLYAAWDKPDEAAKWFKELEMLPKPEAKSTEVPPAEKADEKKP